MYGVRFFVCKTILGFFFRQTFYQPMALFFGQKEKEKKAAHQKEAEETTRAVCLVQWAATLYLTRNNLDMATCVCISLVWY